jgi:hypothetical protein
MVLALADRRPNPWERQSAMHNADTTTCRRSSRVPTAVQILVTSLEGMHFSDVCETMVVNAHGCAMLTRVKLENGIPLHFHSKDGRQTTARVVSCQSTGPDHRTWRLGAKLDQPENFWGLRECPQDWTLPEAAPAPPKLFQVKPPNPPAFQELPRHGNQTPDALLDRAARQFEAQMKRMITEMVTPLQAEIVTLKDRLARREANPSRFEVSLSSIPAELEQQIESRLRKDLGPKVVSEAREQSAHLLASAKTIVDQQTGEVRENFRRMAAEQLGAVEKRAQEISAAISHNTQEHVRGGLEEFQQKLSDGGNSLKLLSEELLEFLQQNLNAEHEARRGDLDQLRAAVASESLRLQQEIGSLDTRIGKLDQSTSSLESGLDQRLSRISSDTVKDTRMQFESAANETLEDLTARSAALLRDQMDETSGNMKKIHEAIVESVSELLKSQSANALQAFEDSMDHLARLSVERWRLKLEGGLTAMTKSLNDQFRLQDDNPETRPLLHN